MKKILFINSDLSTGGAEKAMSIIANELDKRGYIVYMALLRERPYVYKVNPAIEIIQFHNDSPTKVGKFVKRVRNIRNTIKRIRPDTVVTFTIHNNKVLLFSCIGLKVRVIISERLHPLFDANGNRYSLFSRTWTKILYSLASAIVFQTNMAYDCFVWEKIKDRCFVIPNAIDVSDNIYCEGERDKTVVAAGRFTRQKNFEMLIKAFAVFYKKYPDYKLIIYGEGPLRTEYKEMICRLKLQDVVFLPGHVENLKFKIKDAAMYVSSSNCEGISNSMIEALSLGIPSICTNCPVGGAELMIENGENGFLINVGDKSALITAMEKIASDIEIGKKLSRNARSSCSKYAPEIIVDKWECII